MQTQKMPVAQAMSTPAIQLSSENEVPAAGGNIASKIRIPGIDWLRGFAILLMVLDHSLVFLGDTSFLGRHTITRLALPLFCVIAGSLARDGRNLGRIAEIALWGLICSILGYSWGIGQPDILLLIAFGLLVLPYLANLPGLVLCIIQPAAWRLGWSGYEPGLVLALIIVGKLFVDPVQLGQLAPSSGAVLRWIGKRPLRFYVGHIALLGFLAAGPAAGRDRSGIVSNPELQSCAGRLFARCSSAISLAGGGFGAIRVLAYYDRPDHSAQVVRLPLRRMPQPLTRRPLAAGAAAREGSES